MDLAGALKKYFGYDEFRPLQEEIVTDALAGRDVFALMPTGGGKSLCFQLPALMRDGLTIVVSPLISLMKDQVDALQTSGIAATFLNSALNAMEARTRLRGLHRSEYGLLYAAPERLALEHFLENAKRWNTVDSELRAHQVRSDVDLSTDKINGKIQRAEHMKVHTMFVIGKRDLEAEAVSVRVHGKGNLGAKPLGEAIANILQSIRERCA